MPRVPQAQNFVERAPATDAKFRTFDSGADRVARGVQGLAGGIQDFQVAQQQINDLQDEAAAKALDNEAVERTRQILWTGPDAFYAKQGFDAANARPGVEKALNDLRSELTAKATTKQQRRMFDDVFNRRIGAEFEGIARHATGELAKEEERQSIARGLNARDEAITYADDPVRSETAIQTGLSEIRSRADKQGWSPDVAKAEEAKYISSVRVGQIDAKTRADPVTAMALVEKYRDQLLPDDEQKLRDTLYAPMVERRAVADIDAYAGIQTDVAIPAAPGQPPTLARMQQITAFSESRNRERDANGRIITSPKGAQGMMQVMPGTNRDPGFGVMAARDDSDAERTRVGRDYLAAMMKRYGGDPAKAWAAYNAGPGRVDDAVAAHGAGWLGAMPKETRDYVASNTAALGGGQGRYSPRRDDLNGIYQWIDSQPWDFERKQAAREEADKRVARNDMLLRRQEADAHDEALAFVDRMGDGFTSISQLPPALQRRMSPEDRHNFNELAKQNAKPKPRQTDYGFYLQASDAYASNPQAFLAISPAEARVKLSDGDFEQYMGWRRDVLNGGGKAKTPQQVEHSRILSVTADALAADNNPILTGNNKQAMKPENVRRRAAFTSAMADRVREWQAVNGRDKLPSDDDLKRMAANLLIDTNSGVNIFEADDKDIADSISQADRSRITAALRSRGLPVTDANVARFYRQLGAFGRVQALR